jgi:hypothetical protein
MTTTAQPPTRLKVAELTSGVGALVLGVGLGALFPSWFGSFAVVITAVGLFLHAFGMWDKHRLESGNHAHRPAWIVVVYWICWLLLGGVLIILLLPAR